MSVRPSHVQASIGQEKCNTERPRGAVIQNCHAYFPDEPQAADPASEGYSCIKSFSPAVLESGRGNRMIRSDTHLYITELLAAWSDGDARALAELTPLVYQELRALARHHLAAERSGNSLNSTALVHEAWLRLATIKDLHLRYRAQFFALCAQLIRRILIDHARARLRARRGGGAPQLPLEEALLVPEERIADMVALDDALEALSVFDRRKGRVVELRFFGGLSVEEMAEVLKISPESVKRDWRVGQTLVDQRTEARAGQ